MNRREMITAMGVTGLAATGLQHAMPTAAQAQTNGDANADAKPAGNLAMGYDTSTGKYVLPPLPYDYDALEPFIDEQTMRLHHDKHHAGYVRGLNAALDALAKARADGDYALIQHLSRQVSFNGGGHTLHTIFWHNMAPPAVAKATSPSDRLTKMIARDFGSITAMQDHFTAAASKVEGSGWGILAHEPIGDRLIIVQGENQQKLSTWAMRPILVIDVWEHAYYLKYNNRRGDYVKAFWNLVNWQDVSSRLL